MNSGHVNLKIERLTKSNLHVWKHKVQLILDFRDLGDHISELARPSTYCENAAGSWSKSYTKTKEVIGLLLCDEHLDHVRDFEMALSVWITIMDLFQRKTVINKLTTRSRFYSAKMGGS